MIPHGCLDLRICEWLPNNKPLNELGLDSLMAIELCNGLGNALGRTLPATLLYDYPTVEVLARYLSRSVLGLEEISGRSGPFLAGVRRIGCPGSNRES